jgi:hypothetical protein
MSDIIGKNEPLQKVICNSCENHIIYDKCKAFDKIPDEIIFGKNDHSKPLEGQKNNVVYEPKN